MRGRSGFDSPSERFSRVHVPEQSSEHLTFFGIVVGCNILCIFSPFFFEPVVEDLMQYSKRAEDLPWNTTRGTDLQCPRSKVNIHTI